MDAEKVQSLKSIFDYFKEEFCRCYEIEAKPNIDYSVADFLEYIDRRTNITEACLC